MSSTTKLKIQALVKAMTGADRHAPTIALEDDDDAFGEVLGCQHVPAVTRCHQRAVNIATNVTTRETSIPRHRSTDVKVLGLAKQKYF